MYVETEGSRDIWVVALDETSTAVYLHRMDKGFMNEYKLMIQKHPLPDKRSAAVALDAIAAAEGVNKQNMAFTIVAVLLLTLLGGSLWMKPKTERIQS
jgi:glycerate-2-kinase